MNSAATARNLPHRLTMLLLPGIVLAGIDLGCSNSFQSARDSWNASTRVAAPFSVHEDQGRWRLFSPDGRPFFSMGVCCIDPGIIPVKYDPENPSYQAGQHYAQTSQWADATLRRLKSWGFTTAGAWSSFEILTESPEQTLRFTPTLQMGASSGMPWWDMWDPENLRNMEYAAREQILLLRDNPRLLGYYSDNELGWWNATLWKMTLEQPSTSGQRQRLLQLLRDTYENQWDKLAADFEVRSAANWSQLQTRGMLYLKPGGQGILVMRRFLSILADRYYQVTQDIIRKYDRRALFLGDRYQSFYYPEVAQAAARHADVVSINLNPAWNDGTFPRFQLDALHALTNKPLLVSEIYLAAQENRSNNKNTHGIYPVVPTQQARAAAARRTLLSLTSLPYIVGIDWFQYADEPAHGRYDGENFNFGLIDIHDRPYEELTSMFQSIAAARPWNSPPAVRPDAASGIPRAPADPFERFTPTHALENWDRERGFVKVSTPAPVADLYISWKPDGLYLGLYTLDIVEDAYYPGGFVPKTDRALWTVQINNQNPVRARIGAGLEPLVNSANVRIENLTGREVKTYTTAAMRIPAELFGLARLKSGDSLQLDCTLQTHAGAYQMRWMGSFRVSD